MHIYIVGFYPAIDFLSSKLFYVKPLSMQLSYDQRHSLRKYRFFNNVLLENIPLITIQILSIMSNNPINSPIINISLFFSMLSIFILLPKLLYRIHKNRRKSSKRVIVYTIEINSSEIRHNHKYCHQLLADTLLPFFIIPVNRIETLSIESNNGNGNNGIRCKIQVSSNEKRDKIDETMHQITDNNSENCKSFKQLLCKLMSLNREKEDIELRLGQPGFNALELPPTDTLTASSEATISPSARSGRNKKSIGSVGSGMSTAEIAKRQLSEFYRSQDPHNNKQSIDLPPAGPPQLYSFHSSPVNLNPNNQRKSEKNKTDDIDNLHGMSQKRVNNLNGYPPNMQVSSSIDRGNESDGGNLNNRSGYNSNDDMSKDYYISMPTNNPMYKHVNTWSEHAMSQNSQQYNIHNHVGSHPLPSNNNIIPNNHSYNGQYPPYNQHGGHDPNKQSIYSMTGSFDPMSHLSQTRPMSLPNLYDDHNDDMYPENDVEELFDGHSEHHGTTNGGGHQSQRSGTLGGPDDDQYIENGLDNEQIQKFMAQKRRSKRFSNKYKGKKGKKGKIHPRKSGTLGGPDDMKSNSPELKGKGYRGIHGHAPKQIWKNQTPKGDRKVKFDESVDDKHDRNHLPKRRPKLPHANKSMPVAPGKPNGIRLPNGKHHGYNKHTTSPVSRQQSQNMTPTEGKSKKKPPKPQRFGPMKNRKVKQPLTRDALEMHTKINMEPDDHDEDPMELRMRVDSMGQKYADAASDVDEDEENMVYVSDPDEIGGDDKVQDVPDDESSTISMNNDKHILIEKDYETPHETDHESDVDEVRRNNINKKRKVPSSGRKNGRYGNGNNNANQNGHSGGYKSTKTVF